MKNIIVEEDLEKILSHKIDWDRFTGKTILISGAAGFIQAYMVKTLLKINDNGYGDKLKVIGLVRNREKAREKLEECIDRDDFELIVQDVCDPITLEQKIDFVIHAASQASPRYYKKDPVGTLNANVLGTYNLLKLSNDKKVEGFLFFSSGEIYGEVKPSQIPTREDEYGYLDPTAIRSCYSESKRLGETMCVAWYNQFKVPTKIVRPFHTYGPGMALDDGRVYADFISDIINNKNIEIKSDGLATRSFCYISDAVTGFFNVLLNGKPGEAYNIGNDKCEISIYELAEKLVALYPEKKLKIIQNLKMDNKEYIKSPISRNCPDILKANGIGWKPTITIEEGFTRTINSF